jgi:hypothetical protein
MRGRQQQRLRAGFRLTFRLFTTSRSRLRRRRVRAFHNLHGSPTGAASRAQRGDA